MTKPVHRFARSRVRTSTTGKKGRGERAKGRRDAGHSGARSRPATLRLPFDFCALAFPLCRLVAAAVAVAGSAASLCAAPPVPRYAGAATTVAVNRADGRVAVLQGAVLSVYPDASASAAAASFEIPGSDPAVLEFHGNQILYATHGVSEMPFVFVAVSAEGRERLAWPNSGISELFPTDTSRLTLDGKGVFGFLLLDPAARTFFGLADEIPLGAGVAATYRFAGEKLLARGSAGFAAVLALTPDDMLLAITRGGLMRYRSPGGVAWKREGTGGDWRIADVDLRAGVAVAVDAAGAAVATGLENGEPRWRCAVAGAQVRDARLLHDGRALVLTGGSEGQVVALDPATGRPAGPQPGAECERDGLSQVFAGWLAKAKSLAELVDLTTPAGSAWLIRGADGWYEVKHAQ